jgi:hypothetical protein
MRRHLIVTASVVAVLMLSVSRAPAQDVEVSREGKWRLWYTSSDLRAELDYHWADRHLGADRIMLKLSVAGGSTGVTSISRTDVHLRAPDGSRFDLPTQAEFRGIQGAMQAAFQQENVWGPPAARFSGSLMRLVEWFYSPSGATFQRETIHPSELQYCSGPLVFEVPGGVQPGEWTLTIGLDEIPFVLGANE